MSKPNKRFDPTFLVGLLIALACILGGLVLEKGQVRDVTQVTAALIVFGGTIGAVVVATPKSALISAARRAPSVLWSNTGEPDALIEELIGYSLTARRSGTIALESEVEEIDERFLKKGMTLLVDGFTASEIRTLLEVDMILSEQEADNDAKVFDAAGGYAPTIGIIGAVLGLMQVMKHLDNIQEVGQGIAIAFVATVYGVGVANLIFLPMASKIRTQTRLAAKTQEMILEAVIAIQEGKNPRVLRQLLEPFAGASGRKAPEEATGSSVSFAESRRAS
ncbi:MAG: flagellar motor protein [Acidobacteriota bacterium]|nr:flagellar motor protein [Acidobacteriota bacterium]